MLKGWSFVRAIFKGKRIIGNDYLEYAEDLESGDTVFCPEDTTPDTDLAKQINAVLAKKGLTLVFTNATVTKRNNLRIWVGDLNWTPTEPKLMRNAE